MGICQTLRIIRRAQCRHRSLDQRLQPHPPSRRNPRPVTLDQAEQPSWKRHLGVPHLLVVSGEATFNNRADARLELWEHTVIPLLDRLSSALSTWLGPMFDQDLHLAHDLDEV